MIYDYKCSDCENTFEVWAKVSDPAPDCPKCASTKVEKVIAPTAFALKGGGWYSSGYSSTTSQTSTTTPCGNNACPAPTTGGCAAKTN